MTAFCLVRFAQCCRRGLHLKNCRQIGFRAPFEAVPRGRKYLPRAACEAVSSGPPCAFGSEVGAPRSRGWRSRLRRSRPSSASDWPWMLPPVCPSTHHQEPPESPSGARPEAQSKPLAAFGDSCCPLRRRRYPLTENEDYFIDKSSYFEIKLVI